MSLIREVVTGTADPPEGLSAIHRPGCAAAICRRHSLPGFQCWIDALEPERSPTSRSPWLSLQTMVLLTADDIFKLQGCFCVVDRDLAADQTPFLGCKVG